MGRLAYQICINAQCKATYSAEQAIYECARCGSLLDVQYDWDSAEVPGNLRFFETRWGTPGRDNRAVLDFSGVWRFRELLPFARRQEMVSLGEGRTVLQKADLLAGEMGMKPGRLFLQHEGVNPSGSYVDSGMAAAFTMARQLRKARVACASTGNTSASMALYASAGSTTEQPIQAVVFLGTDRVPLGKLTQALDYGALTLQIDGDFHQCMQHARQAADRLNLYLLNSANPYRMEGQKTIIYRMLEGLDWEVPDWVIVPGGNLGNSSAFGKAWIELTALGLAKRIPRLAIINASGANTLCQLVNEQNLRWNGGDVDTEMICRHYEAMDAAGTRPQTVASALEIAKPVNLPKALRALDVTDGVAREVDDQSILDHRALIGRFGFGCEPAAATSVAGLRLLLKEQLIDPDQRVVCILTGHQLKDPECTMRYHVGEESPGRADPSTTHANPPIRVKDNFEHVCRVLESVDHVSIL